MTSKKNWRNILPLDEWMCLHDDKLKLRLTFKLAHFEVINGTPKWTILLKGGSERQAGIGSLNIDGVLSLRLYMPIELSQPAGFKYLSPKMVFSMDRELMVSRLEEVEAATPTLHDSMRTHTPTRIKL